MLSMAFIVAIMTVSCSQKQENVEYSIVPKDATSVVSYKIGSLLEKSKLDGNNNYYFSDIISEKLMKFSNKVTSDY